MITTIVGVAIGFLVGQIAWEGLQYLSHWTGRLVVRSVMRMARQSKEEVHDGKSSTRSGS